MDLNGGALELDQLIALAVDDAARKLHVAVPGVVKSYDATKRTCTVQPAIRRPVEDLDGAVSFEAYEPIQNVPVAHIGGAGFSIVFTLQPGDTVDLLFQDFTFAQWRTTGQIADAPDLHAHGPSYPVAIPWFNPQGGSDTDNSIGAPGGLRLHFGTGALSVGNGSDFVAMSAKVDARISALETYVTGHTHPVPGVTPGPGATVSSAPAPGPTPGTSTASSNLKAD